MHNKFLTWLAVSPLASAGRAGAGAILVWLLNNVADLNLPVWANVAIVAALPPLIRAMNPVDGVFGAGSRDDIEEEPIEV